MIAPEISVVLPVYNGASTLTHAIRSILGQTYGNYEILVLDDGSTDASVDIARKFSDPRLQIFSDGTNHGLAFRLNQGVDLARGHYIARMDQDDICFPERLAKQHEFLERHPEIDLLGCRAVAFNNDKNFRGLMPFRRTHQEICAQPWRGIYLAHPSWMGRTEWFRKHRYHLPEYFCAEDQELLLRACLVSRFECLEDVLLAYRKNDFRFSKVFIARKSLLSVQILHFAKRRQWSNTALSILLFLIKVAVDCSTSLPGCKKMFFMRISRSLPDSVEKDFRRLMVGYE